MTAYTLRRTRADIPGILSITTLSADAEPFATVLQLTCGEWHLYLAHPTPDGTAYDYSHPNARHPDETTALADAKHRHACLTGPYGPGKAAKGHPLPPVHLTRHHTPETEPQPQETAKNPDPKPGKRRVAAPRPHPRPKKADRLRRHLT